MWESIQFITTPLALIAFIVAAVAAVINYRAKQKIELIKTAPENKRNALIEMALETYSIKKDNLSPEQKFQLVSNVISSKTERLKILAKTSVVIALILFTTIIIITIFKGVPKDLLPQRPAVPKTDVLIASFDHSFTQRTYAIENRIEEELKKKFKEYGLVQSVRQYQYSITNEDTALQIAKEAGCSVIVWGWYDDLGIKVRFNVVRTGSNKHQENAFQNLTELPMPLAAVDNFKLEFLLKKDIPENVAFMASYIIGSKLYDTEKYEKAYMIFEHITQNIPENIVLENPGLATFFKTRLKHETNIDAISGELRDTLIDGYRTAINYDTLLSEAYNNLAILLPYDDNEALYCIKRAIKLAPKRAIYKYNKLAIIYNRTRSDAAGHDWKGKYIDLKSVDALIDEDPTIPGTYLMGGMISYDKKDLAKSLAYFMKGVNVTHGNDRAKAFTNIGYLQTASGNLPLAKSAFESALEINHNDYRALIGKSSVEILNKDYDSAINTLNRTDTAKKNTPDIQLMAVVKSCAYFFKKDYKSSIKVLKNLGSNYTDEIEIKANSNLSLYLLSLLNRKIKNNQEAVNNLSKINVYEGSSFVELHQDLWNEDGTCAAIWTKIFPHEYNMSDNRIALLKNMSANNVDKIDGVYKMILEEVFDRLYFKNILIYAKAG